MIFSSVMTIFSEVHLGIGAQFLIMKVSKFRTNVTFLRSSFAEFSAELMMSFLDGPMRDEIHVKVMGAIEIERE